MKTSFKLSILLFILFGCGGDATRTPTDSQKKKEIKSADNISGAKNNNCTSAGKSDEDKYMSNCEPIKSLSGAVSKFIPDGYLPLDTAIGDLDLDGTNDMLLVLKNKYEDTLTPSNDSPQFKRPLMILLGKPDGTYILAKRNDNAIMCINCSGVTVNSDPFTGLKMKNGFFSIEHGEAEGPQHWETVTTFKYDKEQKEWFLFKDGSANYELNDSQDPDADAMKKVYDKVKTKKDFGTISFEKYNLDKN